MEPSDARRLAAEQVGEIVATLVRLGGTATVAAVSAGSGLPVEVVRRRLFRNGPSMIRLESRFFTRSGELWGLTETGRALIHTPTGVDHR